MSGGNMSWMDRRTTIKRIGAVGLSSVVLTGSSTAESTDEANGSDRVSESTARQFAEARVEYNSQKSHFSAFESANLGQPELFYLSQDGEYVPGAWVYPVENDGSEIGHIAAGAQWWLPRIIRSGTGLAPQHRVGDINLIGSAEIPPIGDRARFVYDYPLVFGIEIQTNDTNVDDNFVDLRTGHVKSLDHSVEYRIKSVKEDIGSDEDLTDIRTSSLSFEPASSGKISGVPNWDATKCSDDWVGCVPAASAMCIGYHESIGDECDFMWDLNEYMGTNSDGHTWPRRPWPYDDFITGINEYDSSYAPSNTYVGRPSEIKSQIDSGNPCLVSYFGEKSSTVSTTDETSGIAPSELPDMPVGHAETGYEYEDEDGDLYITTHDTYGNVNELLVTSMTDAYLVQSIEP